MTEREQFRANFILSMMAHGGHIHHAVSQAEEAEAYVFGGGRDAAKIEELGWTIVGLRQEIAALKADKADRVYQSAESKHVYHAVAAMNEAFKPIEAGGYIACHMEDAMQQSRYAIMALAAWTARADDLEGR